MHGSPGSDDFDGGHNDVSKKRKTMPRWTDQVRVILRMAWKDPMTMGIAGESMGRKIFLEPNIPEAITDAPTEIPRTAGLQSKCKDQMMITPYLMSLTGDYTLVVMADNQLHHQHHQKNKNRNKTLINSSNHKMLSLTFKGPEGTCSQSSISPATPESNYCSVSPFQTNNFVGVQNLQYCSESNFTEIISANTSAANSPVVEPEFSLQSLELDPNFPFDTPGFFS
ncbi:hypothetical protein GH714_005682 [Hevea brasiliensis]|uniref:Uncharacterized protein n=1 Tax=Hevea brasiliensis TaxID=3981 RepID=A0A6A6LD45_HEVBR|nr:hypothetical protein GH714_005682 [Hevea brasiliensis]